MKALNEKNEVIGEISTVLKDNKSSIILPETIISEKKEKRINNEIILEDLLENDDHLNDLKMNPNSKFIKLLTTLNINKMIEYCLIPMTDLDKNSKNQLRYPYISCQILCSERVLLFSKSISHIKDSNNLKLNKKEGHDIREIQSIPEDKKEREKPLVTSSISTTVLNDINDEIFYGNGSDIYILKEKDNFDEYFQYKNDFDVEEKYAEISETEIKNNTISIKPITDYDQEEKKIIHDILDKIFQTLREERKKNYQNNPTYLGYFQKIVNYMLFNEENIILDYLFTETEMPIRLFYKHLDQIAIENIMENILNILVDREDKITNLNDSKYNKIILDMLNELANDANFEMAECIFDLIISTLINNSDKHLNELIFNKEKCILKDLRTFIEVIINRENYKKNESNDKTIIGIMKLLCQLNNIIISSFNESEFYKNNNEYIEIPTNVNKKVNTFEYQYTIKRGIKIKEIFKCYSVNINLYLEEINKIFNLIKEDIIIKYNKNIGSENNKDNLENKEKTEKKDINNKVNNKLFDLRHLFEWKFIYNALSIYIYSFYAIEYFDKYNTCAYFSIENLFKIMNKLYFNHKKNNLYQNTFTDIIKILCNEKCPEYILRPILKVKNGKRNKFIFKIITSIKEEIKNKNKLSLGTDIELLRLIYDSNNPYILTIFEKFLKDEYSKTIFNDHMTLKLQRKLLDEWEYSFDEIFNSENENNTTFDGNDEEIKRNFDSFNKMTQTFLNKRKIKNNKKKTNNIKIIIKEKKENYEYKNSVNTIKNIKKIVKYENDINKNNNIEKEEYFGIIAEENFEIEETTIDDKMP